MKTVAFTTLGCRVNQYDTDAMRGLFIDSGYTPVDFDEKADIYVINTCSVTNMGERKSRQLIRKAKRTNEDAYIIVTGCYAQLAPDAIAAIEGVNLVIGTNNRNKVVELVEQLESTEKQINIVRNIMEQSTFEEMPLYGDEIDKARAFMKIQEGCNNYCTFCIIPYTRGKLKSRRVDDILEEAKRLVAHGYKEIVLTGIHLGNYGVELPDKPNLAHVVKALLTIDGLQRIRLGSIESVEVSDELIDLMANEPRFCTHLHLPLQAGSDHILKLMNRHYKLQDFKDLVAMLRNRIPGLAITTDIIAGFPGETDEDFDETMNTVKEIGFTHIHAFPYSIREGTPAATMENQVPEAVKKTRVALLNSLGQQGLTNFANTLIGKKAEILVEREVDGYYVGFTNEYIHGKIKKEDADYPIGSIIGGTVKEFDGESLIIE
ncbi:MAG: tRNA (N(6)-L-threonylcarbamoyladenosine(37)-C(2))-methylthiotransferase MtaB [Veillonella sp.]|uniref:tRNA (N(6)-L-threonylcarbamoyladenosine(37)-C(2))- methylthiotransferase MtaB n=1 Tax=Veillonella sp. TaxID=1926307 RepID=UPI0025DD6BF5|nr:tRNA (N(6)-L-threonylcarbamoyladenosine(37)-C(2))-methylthiotransferase MtaB [Veillonella sp.]MBS4912802.1 tRNA (N(6)-L-threonylcarbamoyladenosine(37)-C(2))-methylthiotransferase MtaB [Veillonella sp.]